MGGSSRPDRLLISLVLVGGPMLWVQVEVVTKQPAGVFVAKAAPDEVAIVKGA